MAEEQFDETGEPPPKDEIPVHEEMIIHVFGQDGHDGASYEPTEADMEEKPPDRMNRSAAPSIGTDAAQPHQSVRIETGTPIHQLLRPPPHLLPPVPDRPGDDAPFPTHAGPDKRLRLDSEDDGAHHSYPEHEEIPVYSRASSARRRRP